MDVNAIASLSEAMSNIELATQYSAKVMGMQKDLVNMQGDMALKLLESAAVTEPGVGANLNIQI